VCVMLLDYGMSLKDIAERFKLEVKTVERLIIEHERSRASKQNTSRKNGSCPCG
jgi:transposase